MRSIFAFSLAVLAATTGACSSSKSTSCNPSDPAACSGLPGGAVCESVEGGGSACFLPLFVSGKVTDLETGLAIAGARVVALDANRAPASAVGTTDAGGNYRLSVHATRSPDGRPVLARITLRADAQDYQTFPGGVRSALPIDLSTATDVGAGGWDASGPLTSVGLIPLPDTTDLLSISGVIELPPSRVGLLVVAEPQAGGAGLTGIADPGGSYTIFNVPAADAPGTAYAVDAYGRGVNYVPATVTLVRGASAPAVNLAIRDATTALIDGSLIYNSGATTPTSVALVVKSTYSAVLDRGESPPSLVAPVPSGSTYTLQGVPDGTFIALAAFGIDGDVRDLSDTGNTAPVEVVVQDGALVGTLGAFKLVGAVELTSIDGVAVGGDAVPVRVTSASPTFEWAKAPSYASAATFQYDVYDAFGINVWSGTRSGGGAGPFTATYAGEPLRSGMYYQLRVKAIDTGGSTLSQSEDLKGVFFRP